MRAERATTPVLGPQPAGHPPRRGLGVGRRVPSGAVRSQQTAARTIVVSDPHLLPRRAARAGQRMQQHDHPRDVGAGQHDRRHGRLPASSRPRARLPAEDRYEITALRRAKGARGGVFGAGRQPANWPWPWPPPGAAGCWMTSCRPPSDIPGVRRTHGEGLAGHILEAHARRRSGMRGPRESLGDQQRAQHRSGGGPSTLRLPGQRSSRGQHVASWCWSGSRRGRIAQVGEGGGAVPPAPEGGLRALHRRGPGGREAREGSGSARHVQEEADDSGTVRPTVQQSPAPARVNGPGPGPHAPEIGCRRG